MEFAGKESLREDYEPTRAGNSGVQLAPLNPAYCGVPLCVSLVPAQ